MSLNWYRRYQLVAGIAGQGGVSIDNLTDEGLKIRFEITKSLMKEPNEAKFEIFNTTAEHANAFQDEYTDVYFNAGYEGNIKKLFDGNIQYCSNYRDKTEWITEIICGDGDQAFRTTYINKTFSAGTTDENIVDFVREQFNLGKLRERVTKGIQQFTNIAGALRGRTFSKPAHEVLDEIAKTNGSNWSIQDGQLQMVRADAMLSVSEAVVLTPETGLLEAAERTDKGITARAFLNPAIAVNTAVKLDNSAIRTKSRNRKSITRDQRGRVVELNPDGIYKVFKVRHSGDTRGTEWVTEILCVGLGQSIPTGQTDTSPGVPVSGAGANDAQIIARLRTLQADVVASIEARAWARARSGIEQMEPLAAQLSNSGQRQSWQQAIQRSKQEMMMEGVW